MLVDPSGLKWEISRAGGAQATATVKPGTYENIQNLARDIGLDAADYKKWLTAGAGTTMPSSQVVGLTSGKFNIPNTVIAYWAGWGTDVGTGKIVGKVFVEWDAGVKYLRARGFKVDARDHVKGAAYALQKNLQASASAKALHGLYFWGHGSAPYPSKRLLSESKDTVLEYASVSLPYKMALGLVFACDSISGKPYLSSGTAGHIWVPIRGTLVPLPFYQPQRVWYRIKPGDQGTK